MPFQLILHMPVCRAMHTMPIFLPLCYAHMLSFCSVIPSQQLPTMLTLCSPSQFKFSPKIKACAIFVTFGSEIDGSLQSGSEYCDPWLGSSVSHCQTIPQPIMTKLCSLLCQPYCSQSNAGILCVSLPVCAFYV